MKQERNPFADEDVAQEWVKSVEGERGLLRDTEIYPRLRAWSRRFPAGLVVEIGAGQGICSTKLTRRNGGRYLGIEPSEYLVHRAKTRYGKAGRLFKKGDAYALPCKDRTAVAAFSTNVWFHLRNLSKASQELSRILKQGGDFLIVTGNPGCWWVWESLFVNPVKRKGVLFGKVRTPVVPLSRVELHLHPLSHILQALERAGLTVNHVETFGSPEKKPHKRFFVEIIGQKT